MVWPPRPGVEQATRLHGLEPGAGREVAVDVGDEVRRRLGGDHAHLAAAPSLTITALATVEPFTKFRFEAFGCGCPHG